MFQASKYPVIKSSETGFSLIELAIFMMVMAVILTTALSWLAPTAKDEAEKVLLTHQRVRAVQQALRTFRVNHERLPCPANPLIADNNPDTLAGVEDCSGYDNTGMNLGTVPFRTLGLSAEYRVDGWGRRFTYHVSTRLCGLSQDATPINCTAQTFKDGIDDGTALTVRTVRPNAPDPSDPTDDNNYINNTDVAYVVVSHGINGDGAFMPSGQQRLSGRAQSTCSHAECKEQFNIANLSAPATAEDPDSIYWSDNYSSEFDDFILYETKQQIDLVTLDFEEWVIALADCTNDSKDDHTISGFLEGFDSFLDINSMNQIGGNSYKLFGDVTNAEGMMSMLWYIQDICSRYYPAAYEDDADFGCVGNLDFDNTKGNPDPLLDKNRGYCD